MHTANTRHMPGLPYFTLPATANPQRFATGCPTFADRHITSSYLKPTNRNHSRQLAPAHPGRLALFFYWFLPTTLAVAASIYDCPSCLANPTSPLPSPKAIPRMSKFAPPSLILDLRLAAHRQPPITTSKFITPHTAKTPANLAITTTTQAAGAPLTSSHTYAVRTRSPLAISLVPSPTLTRHAAWQPHPCHTPSTQYRRYRYVVCTARWQVFREFFLTAASLCEMPERSHPAKLLTNEALRSPKQRSEH